LKNESTTEFHFSKRGLFCVMKIVPRFSDEINKTKETDTLEFEKALCFNKSRISSLRFPSFTS